MTPRTVTKRWLLTSCMLNQVKTYYCTQASVKLKIFNLPLLLFNQRRCNMLIKELQRWTHLVVYVTECDIGNSISFLACARWDYKPCNHSNWGFNVVQQIFLLSYRRILLKGCSSLCSPELLLNNSEIRDQTHSRGAINSINHEPIPYVQSQISLHPGKCWLVLYI